MQLTLSLRLLVYRLLAIVGGGAAALLVVLLWSHYAHAAVLRIDPVRGTYDIGSTVTVGVYVDTEGETINAIEASVSFPPDRLQLVSPSSGNSIISIYTTPPRVNNKTGRLDIAGGITGGANVNAGLIATLTFRVTSVGTASLRFLDNSKVLLHNGEGANALRDTVGATYALRLPPPNGPEVTSPTHPEQGKWYASRDAILNWTVDPAISGYSYAISDSPTTVPDDVSEGLKNQAVYNALPEGNQFFHIKALRDGVWGGVTHYQLSVDATGPADAPLEISPGARTTVHEPYIKFSTTDALSGIDHYEIKIIALKIKEHGAVFQEQPLYTEAQSPYLPSPLPLGSYEVIVRAYDKAGNYTDMSERLDIVSHAFRFFGPQGIALTSSLVISWWWLLLALVVIVVLVYVARHSKRWHGAVPVGHVAPFLPEQLKSQLNELQMYRERYGKLIPVLLLLLLPFVAVQSVSAQVQQAQSTQQVPQPDTTAIINDPQVVNPPSITAYTEQIYDEEIFYIGGRTEYPETPVVIHVQNQVDGQSFEFHTVSDKCADWFYRHNGFLGKGTYVMWVQAERNGAQSVPSAQVEMKVSAVAIKFGGTALSLEAIYLIAFLIAAGMIVLLIGYIVYHAYHGRKKRQQFVEEVRRAEQSIRRGFAVLKRDIEAELDLMKRAQLSAELSAEERVREQQLKADLESIQGYISKEIWEAEHYAGTS